MDTVKDIAKEIKELIIGNHNIDIEEYAKEVESRSPVKFDDFKILYNNLFLIKNFYDIEENNELRKRPWNKFEDDFVMYYADLAIRESREVKSDNRATKKEILKDVSELLTSRTESSVMFRYYELQSENRDAENSKPKKIKKVKAKEKASKSNVVKEKVKEDDLVDVLAGIVDNVEKSGINVSYLFGSILELSKRSVENGDSKKAISELEREVSHLREELQDERSRNKILENESGIILEKIEKIKKEVFNFEGLEGKDKIRELNNFSKRMKYIVNNSGVIEQVRD